MRHDVLTAAIENLFGEAADQKATEAETIGQAFCEAMQDAIDAWAFGPVPAYVRPVAHQLQALAADLEALPRNAKGVATATGVRKPVLESRH